MEEEIWTTLQQGPKLASFPVSVMRIRSISSEALGIVQCLKQEALLSGSITLYVPPMGHTSKEVDVTSVWKHLALISAWEIDPAYVKGEK